MKFSGVVFRSIETDLLRMKLRSLGFNFFPLIYCDYFVFFHACVYLQVCVIHMFVGVWYTYVCIWKNKADFHSFHSPPYS